MEGPSWETVDKKVGCPSRGFWEIQLMGVIENSKLIELESGFPSLPNFEARKLKPREGKEYIQSHQAHESQSQHKNP